MTFSDHVQTRRIAILVSTALLLFILTIGVASAQSKQPTGLDSYLPYKVYSVDQLINEVQGNPAIIAHYSRTFHVPEDKVVQYMRNNVVESYIQETGKYTVYCVRPDGLVYPTVQHFQQGTKVFALRNGQPIMKWACGNPLMNFLPAVHEVVKPVVKVVTKVSPSVETLVPAEAAQEEVPVEEVAPVYQPKVPVMASPMAFTAPIAATSHISPLFLLPIALLPTFGGHGGNKSGGTTGGGSTSGGSTTGGTTSSGSTAGTTSGGTSTGGGGSTTGGTTSGLVPEAAPGATVTLGCILLAVAALVASMKKPKPSTSEIQ
jgi:hypothetical protein